MDLFCPHCTRRVSIPDDKAGQVLSCPLCAKQFMAPSLAPPPSAPKPPAPPPSPVAPASAGTYNVGPARAPAPAPAPAPPAPAPSPPEPAPAPPPPPGEYTRSCVCCLNGAWLAFVPLGCLLAIFVLSFFSWHLEVRSDRQSETMPALNLWQLSAADKGQAQLAYTILMFPCGLFALIAMLLDKGWIATPPQLAPVMTFKNLIVGLLLGLAFLMLCVDSVDAHFIQRSNAIAVPLKIAFRLHLIAVLASFGMFWLHWRKKSNLPLPKVEAHW